MSNQTTNYNLKKPVSTENYNVDDQNGNMDLIDQALTPTADPALVATGNGPGKLVQWLGWLTNRIKAITGKTNWWDAPATTLEAASTHAGTSASETVKAHVELATAAETTTGTDNTRAVHPAGLKVELDKKMNTAGGTFAGNVAHARNEVQQPKIKDYSEVVSTNAASTGTVSLNIANGNVFDITLTGNTIFTFDNPTSTGQACSLTLILRQGGTSRTVTWPASIKWSNDQVPDVSDINKTAILTFFTLDGGTRWYGFLSGNKLVT